jgi:hypothetical protein
MCYGLVRELSRRYDEIILYVIPHCSELHIDNIKRLYSSISNVRITTENPALRDGVVYLGYNKFFEAVRNDKTTQIQRYIYAQFDIPVEAMWDSFYFERNSSLEKDIYYRIGLRDGEDYIFLHDDPSRGFIINRDYVRDTRIVRLADIKDVSILDSLYLVEKAAEVHTFNTGLLSFIDQIGIVHDNLNYHRYVRPLAFEQPILKLKWNIYE